MARKLKRRRKARSNRKQRKPTKKFRRFERQLERFTRGLIKELQIMVKQTIVPRVKLLAETSKTQVTEVPQVRFDDNEGQDLENLVDVVEAQFLGRFSRRFIRSNLEGFFKELDLEADQETLGEFARQNITVSPGADTRATIENAINTSTPHIIALIRNNVFILLHLLLYLPWLLYQTLSNLHKYF